MIWLWALAKRALQKVPTRYLSEERYDELTLWLVGKMWRHEDRVNRAFGVTPAHVTGGPRPKVRLVAESQEPTTTAGGGRTYSFRWSA